MNFLKTKKLLQIILPKAEPKVTIPSALLLLFKLVLTSHVAPNAK
jgi:hypothetical protein